MRRTDRKHAAAERGLTLVEVLVVVGIIVLLVTLVIVGLAAASSRAASARSVALMTSMNQGFFQYEQDFGRLPEVLGGPSGRDAAMVLPANANELQDWFSITSPAEYLLGYGAAMHDGANGLGFRDTGTDGVWNSTVDTDGDQLAELTERAPTKSGKIRGPYLELEDDRLVGNLDVTTGRVLMPNDPGYDALQQDPDGPVKVIVDYWGEPIRYYRQHPLRNDDGRQLWTLGDVYVLRPFSIPADQEVLGAPDAAGDEGTTMALRSARFALFSTGPDRLGNRDYRYDDPDAGGTEGVNEDNIVEIGK